MSLAELLEQLIPPPQFANVSFESYVPDPQQPSQSSAVAAMRAFVDRRNSVAPKGRSRRKLFRAATPPEDRPGIYLDGGFGVGKTHLLASLWHEWSAPAAFGTFVEFTHLVGALGFARAVEVLSDFTLICIDEFELDDPGDTVLMSSLLSRLVEAGVSLAATSNTLPDRLGEGRFAAEDFLREIQRLSASFEVLRIDGADYRHRGIPEASVPWTDAEVKAAAQSAPTGSTLDSFIDVQHHLATIHPSRYGALVEGIPVVHLLGVRTLTDQVQALRTVVLIDRLYDRGVPVVTSGVPLDQLFSESMLGGGYRKKYRRALSRIMVLANADH